MGTKASLLWLVRAETKEGWEEEGEQGNADRAGGVGKWGKPARNVIK